MYELAEERYMKDLDIVNIMAVIKQSGDFLKNHMRRDEKLLLQFNASNLVEVTDSEEGG